MTDEDHPYIVATRDLNARVAHELRRTQAEKGKMDLRQQHEDPDIAEARRLIARIDQERRDRREAQDAHAITDRIRARAKRRLGRDIQDLPLSSLGAAPYEPVHGPTLALRREGGVLVARVVSEAGEVLREMRGEDAAAFVREALGVEVQADDQPLTVAALAGQPCELRYILPTQEEKKP